MLDGPTGEGIRSSGEESRTGRDSGTSHGGVWRKSKRILIQYNPGSESVQGWW